MTLSGSHPWLFSLAFHVALGGLLLAVYAFQAVSRPSLVTMHLIQTGSRGEPAVSALRSTWSIGSQKEEFQNNRAPSAPEWRALSSATAFEPTSVPVPAELDELLGSAPPSESLATTAAEAPVGWSSASGEGYAPPPLPPPTLAPPQGAGWTLTIAVPGGGGGASAVEGIDSGHPALDRWLDDYLRTVSFPPSPDGQPYKTRWILQLETGKPR